MLILSAAVGFAYVGLTRGESWLFALAVALSLGLVSAADYIHFRLPPDAKTLRSAIRRTLFFLPVAAVLYLSAQALDPTAFVLFLGASIFLTTAAEWIYLAVRRRMGLPPSRRESQRA